jgi:hypothetical protein
MATVDEIKEQVIAENTPEARPELSTLVSDVQPVSVFNPVSQDSPAYEVSGQRLTDIAAEQQRFKDTFDIGGAALAGYKDPEILNYVLQVYPNPQGAEGNMQAYQKARAEGYSDSEILAHLTRAQSTTPLGAFTQEAAKGVVEMSPTAAGGYMGFQIGMLGGPAAWLTAPLGTLIGAGAGYLAGDALSGMLFSEEPYTPSVRPFGESGYTFGAGLTIAPIPALTAGKFIPGTMSFSRNIANLNGRNQFTLQQFKPTMVERMQKTAVERPGAFFRTEAAGIGGSAYGTYLAESSYPGDALVRMGAEIGLGVASPVAVADGVLSFGKNQLVNAYKTLTEEGRMSRQGQALYKFLKENGESPEALLAAVKNQDEMNALAAELGVKLGPRTTAGVTGSPAMLLLQNTLAQDKSYGPTVRNAIRQDYDGMTKLIELMTASGDQTLISKAAELRKQTMEGMIIQRLDDINATVIRLNKAVAPDDQNAAMKASQNIETLTDKAIKEMRDVESGFYNAVDGKEIIEIPNLTSAYRNMENELTELGISMPPAVRRLVFKAEGESVEVAEANAEKISRINTRITAADEKIAAINASNPDSIAAVNARISTDVPFEQQLVEVQDAIRSLEADDALTTLGIKAPERNRQLTILRNKAQQLNGRLEIDDLRSQKALPPEGADMDVTLGEVMNARTQLLNKAREATANNRFQEAHFYSDLADSIVDDFGIKAADGKTLTTNQQALREAFDFSKAMNDVFTRAFPNVILSRNKTGARRIMPELLSKTAFSGGGDATSVKYNQLEDAMTFVVDNAGANMDETMTGMIGSMRASQEDLMRVAFEKLVDPSTGRVSQARLDKFKEEYRNVLFDPEGNSKFPMFTSDLENVATAENMLEARLRLTGDPRFNQPGANLNIVVDGQTLSLGKRAPKGLLDKALQNEISFYNSIGSDANPNKLLGATIGSPGARPDNPLKGFRTLIRNTKSAESKFPGATEGLRDMVIDRAYAYSSGMNEAGEQTFSFSKFNQFLNQPLAKGQPSPLEIMRQEGIVDDGFAVRLNILMEEGAKTQTAIASARSGDAPTTELPVPLLNRGFDTFVYLAGLRLGRAATSMAPGRGQGLAEPMLVGREIMDVFVDQPATKQNDLLLDAAMNPEFFKLLMEKAEPGTSRYVNRNNRLRAYLVNSGFIGATAEERYNEQRIQRMNEQAPPTPMMMPGLIRDGAVPVTPDISPGLIKPDQKASLSVPTQQVAPPTTALASAAPVQTQSAPSGPVDRSRYAAMFPTDIASSMIRQQGIGSLMG